MKHPRLWTALALFALLAVVGSMALSRAGDAGDRGFSSGSYLITNKDSGGNFFFCGVITLHADHTVSITDSAQGDWYISSAASWAHGSRTPAAGSLSKRSTLTTHPTRTSRAWNLSLSCRATASIRGTEIITLHPLDDEHALEDEGTFFGFFTITGELIKP